MPKGATTVKEALLAALAKHPNLKAKELHAHLKDEQGIKAPTYQAVHKTLTQLFENGDLEKARGQYFLSPSYLRKLEQHHELATRTHQWGNRSSLTELKPGQSVSLEFNDTIVTPYYWLLGEMYRLYQLRGPSKEIRFFVHGLWPASILAENEYKKLQEIVSQSKLRICCYRHTSNKNWDSFFEELWKEMGAKIDYVPPGKLHHGIDTLIFQDFFIQVEQEAGVVFQFEKLARMFLPKNLIAKTYTFIFNEKGKIKIHITRNAVLAQSYHSNLT